MNNLESFTERYYTGEVFAKSNNYKYSLAKAIEMEEKGVDSDAIMAATKWFRGKYDNKWRIEIMEMIDLSSLVFEPYYDHIHKSEMMEMCCKLSDIVKDDHLLAAYPNLGSVEVQIIYGKGLDTTGEYTPSRRLVYAEAEELENTIPIIIHEIQHIIQTEEDFARGGSPDDFKRTSNGRLRNLKDRRTLYMNLAGEIEARDVQARSKYNKQQRKDIKPFSTEDVSPDDAGITYRD